jgi:hypothetical protein
LFNYKEQLEMLDNIRLKEGESRRIDCPFCGGNKTFGIKYSEGARVWNCFKASCGIRGAKKVGYTLNGLKDRLSAATKPEEPFAAPLPPNLSPARNHPEAVHYLKGVNSLQAYEDGLIDVRYSPALRRVIFMFPCGTAGVGRSLRNEKPKWKNYGNTSDLLQIGSGKVAVVVEDAASAASVSRFSFCSGCALLGTNVSSQQRSQLLHFTKVIVALDKDASKKAIKLKSKLEGRVNTKVVFLEDDLKWLNRDQIQSVLGEDAIYEGN